ncbi:MAG: motility protein A, partial [Clostridia bacterium]|nr:motility protein A [Clostridia bacterium]
FYGSVLANCIFTPLAGKLKGITDQEVKYNELILEGLLSIQAGENPRLIEEKLRSFISKQDQQKEQKSNNQGSVEA